jgi:hypothetical protein
VDSSTGHSKAELGRVSHGSHGSQGSLTSIEMDD